MIINPENVPSRTTSIDDLIAKSGADGQRIFTHKDGTLYQS